MDNGTFVKSPSMFFQLYTWHAVVGNSYPPCIYFLFSKKTKETYKKMFTILKTLVPKINPRIILTDFEKAYIGAAQENFPESEIK